MEIILAILAVIIIGAIAAFVFLKNRRSDLTKDSFIAHTPTETVSPQISVAQPDLLVESDASFDENLYDETIHELKRVLMSNPNNTVAMLKLLQVYGITNNHTGFNQLHQKIHEIGDIETIKQADFFQSLLNEPVAEPIAEPAVSHIQKAPPADDFDLEFNTPAPTLSSATDDKLDFDEFATESPNQTKEHEFDLSFDEPVALEEISPDFDKSEEVFSLDFDDSALQETTETLEPEKPLTQEDALAFDDFDFNEPKQPKATEVHEKEELILDEFSFDEQAFDEPITEKSFDIDRDFAFDKSTKSTKEDTQSLDNEVFDLDFSFDEDLSQNEVSPHASEADFEFEDFSDTASNESVQAEEGFDLGDEYKEFDDVFSLNTEQDTANDTTEQSSDLNFDLSSELAQPEQTVVQTEMNNKEAEKAFFDNSLEDNTAPDESVLDFDDLSFADDDTVGDVSIPTSTTEAEPKPEETNWDSQQPVVQAAATTTTSTSQTSQNLAAELGFTSKLNNAKITLDLASQYLNLGEQDSAKRLLEEVATTGDDEQKMAANALLKRIG